MTDREAFEAWYLSITETSYRADLWHAWQEATRLEREACAKECDDRHRWIADVIVPGLAKEFRGADSFVNGSWQEAEKCASLIRARSEG